MLQIHENFTLIWIDFIFGYEDALLCYLNTLSWTCPVVLPKIKITLSEQTKYVGY